MGWVVALLAFIALLIAGLGVAFLLSIEYARRDIERRLGEMERLVRAGLIDYGNQTPFLEPLSRESRQRIDADRKYRSENPNW